MEAMPMSYRVLFVPLLLIVSVLLIYCPVANASEQPAENSTVVSPSGSGQRQGDESSLPPLVGKKAPDFTLKTLDGKPVQLSKLTAHGPVVILVLRGWPGCQCPICTRQMGDFLTKAEEFQAEKASVVLVYPGPADNLADHAKEFLGEKALPSPFLFVTDPDYAFTTRYRLRWHEPRETACPSTFVVDRNGNVRFAKVSKTHAGRTSVKEVLAVVSRLKQSDQDVEHEGGKKPRDEGVPEFDLGAETATHTEAESLNVEFQSLTSLRLHPDGDLLACDGQAQHAKVM